MHGYLVLRVHAASWHLLAFFASLSWGQWFPGAYRISGGALDTALRGTESASGVYLHGSCIDESTSCRCLELQKILCFISRHSIEMPGIHSCDIKEVKEHPDVPPFVSASVGIHCDILIHQIYSTHMLIVQLHREGLLDVEDLLLFLAPSLCHIYWGQASAGRGHVNHWTIKPTCDSDVSPIGHDTDPLPFCLSCFSLLSLSCAPWSLLLLHVPVP